MQGGSHMEEVRSIDIARAALRMALTSTRAEEHELQREFGREKMKTVAVEYGGVFIASFQRVVERAIVAAKREGVIEATHLEEGAVAGAARESLSQVLPKAMGLNVGGKIGIARKGGHIGVAVFFAVGLLHLDEIAVGLSHRAVPNVNNEKA